MNCIYYDIFINDTKNYINILLCKCICNYILYKMWFGWTYVLVVLSENITHEIKTLI